LVVTPGQSAARLEAGAAGTVVADPQPQQPGDVHHVQRGVPRAVLGKRLVPLVW
jgi:hypothetical protein